MLVYKNNWIKSVFKFTYNFKLGGIVIPNDGNCHLDAKGRYTKSNVMVRKDIIDLTFIPFGRSFIAERHVNVI